MTNLNLTALRIVLVLTGAAILYIALNVALGGFETLGWFGLTDFVEQADPDAYLIQDSHMRYLGGTFTGIALFFFLGASNPARHKALLQTMCGLVFVGGLFRFTQGHLEVTFGPGIIGSLIAELALMPLLFWWITKSVAPENSP